MNKKNIGLLLSMFILFGGAEIKSSNILQAIGCPDLFGKEAVETIIQQVEEEAVKRITEQIAVQTITETIVKESSINTFKNIGNFTFNCVVKTGSFCLNNPKITVAIFLATTAVAGYIGTKYKQKQLANLFKNTNLSIHQTFKKKMEENKQEQQEIVFGLQLISSLTEKVIKKQKNTEDSFNKNTTILENLIQQIMKQEEDIKTQKEKIKQHKEKIKQHKEKIIENIKLSDNQARSLLQQLEPNYYAENKVAALTSAQIETALNELFALKTLAQITREAKNLKVFDISNNKQKINSKIKPSSKTTKRKNNKNSNIKNEPFVKKTNKCKFYHRKTRQALRKWTALFGL
jgi:hypothetical protein